MSDDRLPAWFKVRFPGGENYRRIKEVMRGRKLHTICEEAHCPNIGECWDNGTATFLILGDICTRACAYCAVTSGKPNAPVEVEPRRVASAVKAMALTHAVVTSVNRDDLVDGGASVYVHTLRLIRESSPGCRVELLIPDYQGKDLQAIVDERPDILNHNIESVARLFPRVRPKGSYARSIELLAQAKEWSPELVTKSGIIVGMGESKEEVLETMADLREAAVDILTIGQYLRPTEKHIQVSRYYQPEEFEDLKAAGKALGFVHVESGPLVRSSYHAHEQVEDATVQLQT